MCRLVGWIASEPVSLAEVLGPAALARLTALSSFHAHGWGIAWRTGGELHVRRSTRAARDDADFTATARDVRAEAAVVHLRWATPGLGLGTVDTHPFVRGDAAMAHNGAIGPHDRLGALLAPGDGRRPHGTTDSEHLFLGITGEAGPDGDLVDALERTSTRAAEAGLHSAALNAMVLRPDGLHVVNWHDAGRVPAVAAASNADDPTNPPYFDLRHRSTPGLDVVVSSGFVPDAGSWDLLPPASVTHLPGPGRVHRRDLRPRRALCPV